MTKSKKKIYRRFNHCKKYEIAKHRQMWKEAFAQQWAIRNKKKYQVKAVL